MNQECFDQLKAGSIGKGDVLGVARIAGIMGAKKTSELIPLCHLLNLTKTEIDFELEDETCSVRTICTVRTTGKTGVEMEALTGVQIALLTIYDMCKAVDKMCIRDRCSSAFPHMPAKSTEASVYLLSYLRRFQVQMSYVQTERPHPYMAFPDPMIQAPESHRSSP